MWSARPLSVLENRLRSGGDEPGMEVLHPHSPDIVLRAVGALRKSTELLPTPLNALERRGAQAAKASRTSCPPACLPACLGWQEMLSLFVSVGIEVSNRSERDCRVVAFASVVRHDERVLYPGISSVQEVRKQVDSARFFHVITSTVASVPFRDAHHCAAANWDDSMALPTCGEHSRAEWIH